MSQHKTVDVVLESVNGNKTKGTAEIDSFDDKERIARATRFAMMTMGLCIASIFVPIAHFFLVPFFFIASPVVFYVVSGQGAVIHSGSGICPECGKKMEISKGRAKFPMDDLCEHCKRPVKLLMP